MTEGCIHNEAEKGRLREMNALNKNRHYSPKCRALDLGCYCGNTSI